MEKVDISKIITGTEQRKRLEEQEKKCKTCAEGYDNPSACPFICNGADVGYRPIQCIAESGPSRPIGKFESIGRTLGELVDNKQQAYGDAITAVEQMMKVLYPNGVKVEQYRDMLLMVRIMDKQCRIAKGDKKAFGESPFNDIAGYGLLGVGHE